MRDKREGNGNDLDGWDDLLDPYQYAREKGAEEGRIAGLQSGFQSGQALGHVKALEMGVELGYMKCIVTQRLEEEEKNKGGGGGGGGALSELERKKIERMHQLVKAIESFPTPEEIFASTQPSPELNDVTNIQSNVFNEVDNARATTTSINIVDKMQRLRAKFTLFLKQSKLSHLSLKKVMDSVSTNSNESGDEHGNGDNGETSSGTGTGGFDPAPTNEWWLVPSLCITVPKK